MHFWSLLDILKDDYTTIFEHRVELGAHGLVE